MQCGQRTPDQAVFNPHLPDDDFEAAVHIAQAEFDQQRQGVRFTPLVPDTVPISDSFELLKNSGLPQSATSIGWPIQNLWRRWWRRKRAG